MIRGSRTIEMRWLKCVSRYSFFSPSLSRRRLELDELIRRHHLRVKSFRNEHKDWGIKSGGGGWRDRKEEGEKNAKSSIDKRASTNISTRQRVFRCNYPPPTPINSYLSANSITPSESIPSPPVEISKISEEEKWFHPWTRWPVYEKRSFPPAQRVQRRRGRRQGDNDGRKSEERLGWEVGRSKGDMSRQSKQLKSINRPSGRFADPRKGWEGLLEFRWMKIEASEEEEEKEEAPFRPHPRNLAAERFKTFN